MTARPTARRRRWRSPSRRSTTSPRPPTAAPPPASAKTSENADLVFHDIAVADVDAGSGAVSVTLSADHGTLSLGGTDGLGSLTGNNSATVSFTGTLALVNAALDGLTFRPDANY